MFNKKIVSKLSVILTAVFFIQSFSCLNTLHASAQNSYINTENDNDILNKVIDYSYAGYMAGSEVVPSYNGATAKNNNVFYVDYLGEGVDHTSAILNTINNAIRYGKLTRNTSIILFGPYTYQIDTNESIKIESDNIILKGSVDDQTGKRTELYFTQKVKNDSSSEGYFLTLGGHANAPVRTVNLKATSVSNVKFNLNNQLYNYNIAFEKQGSKEIFVTCNSILNYSELIDYTNGSLKIKQVVPPVGFWNNYADDGIGALKTIVYGDADDSEGEYYKICSQLRPVMTDSKNIYEYHTIKSIAYITKNGNGYLYKILLNEPIKINYIESSQVEFYGKSEHLHFKNIGIEDIDFKCDWYASFNHYTAVRTTQYYGYYGIKFINVRDAWVKNADFENFVQGLELDNCFRMTVDNLKFKGVYTHHSVIVKNSTDCLVMNVSDNEQVWHGPTATSSTAGTVFLNCEFSNETCPDLHSDTPFATLYDNCSGAFCFKHQGGTMSRMPTHFDNLVFWNFENRRGDGEVMDVWAFNDDNPSAYSNQTYYMSPMFVGIKGHGLNFDERDMYYYQKDVPGGVPSLYLYQLKQRSNVSNGVISNVEKTYDTALYNDLKTVEEFEVTDITMNSCTLVWDSVEPVESTDDVYYIIYIYNYSNNSWESYRDTSNPREKINYDEETGKYSTTFTFFAPESERTFSVRAYSSRGDYNIYGGFADSVTVKNSPVPAVTGLSYSIVSENSAVLQWNPIPNTTGYALYYVYCYNDANGKWEKVQQERISGTRYTVSGLNCGEIKKYKVMASLLYNEEEIFDGPISDEEICVCTAPNVTGLNVTDRNANGYTLVWDKNNSTNLGYCISRLDKVSNEWVELTSEPVYDNKFVVTDAQYGENTCYRVCSAYTYNGKLYKSNSPAEITASAMPQITGYRVTDNEINGFSIVWDELYTPDGRDVGYTVYKYDSLNDMWISYRDTQKSKDIKFDPDTSTYKFSIDFYPPSSETLFKICAYINNSDGIAYSDYTPELSGKCLDLPKVRGLKVTGSNYNSCEISWNSYNITWNVYYRVYRYDRDSNSYTLITDNPLKTTSYTVNDLSTGKINEFAVTMYYYIDGAYYEGPMSDIISACAVPSVSGFNSTGRTSDGYTLVWNDCSYDGFDFSYEIERYNNAAGNWEIIAHTSKNTTSFKIEKEQFGVNAEYRIRACYECDGYTYYGNYTDKFVTSAIASVDTLTVTDNEINGFTIKWKGIDCPENSDVYYLLYKYDETIDEFTSYRSTKSSSDLIYDEQTDTYSYKFSFYSPGSVNLFAVRACVLNGSQILYGDFSDTVAAIPLNVPKVTGLRTSITSIDSAKINWDYYNIKWNMFFKVYSYNSVNDSYSLITEQPVSTSSYELTDLVAGNSYNYAVSMYYYINGEYFEGEKSDVVTVCTIPNVTGLKLTERTADSYKIVWNDAGSKYYYNVYRFNSNAGVWELASTVNDAFYTVQNAALGDIDKYRVETCYSFNGTVYTGNISDTLLCAAMPPVTGFEVELNTVNGYRISWDGKNSYNSGNVYYILSKYDDISGQWVSYRDSKTSADVLYDTFLERFSITFSFYNPGSTVKFKVTPYIFDSNGKCYYGDDSEIVNATALNVPKATNLNIVSRDENGCQISWDKLDVKGYVYYRVYSVDENGNAELITNSPLNKNSYYIDNLEYGKEQKFAVSYYFYINGEYFEGEMSDPVSAWIMPKASGLKVSRRNDYSYTLSWDKYENNYGNVRYQLYRYNDLTGNWDTFGRALSDNSLYIEESFGVSSKYKVAVLLEKGSETYCGNMSDEVTASAMSEISGFQAIDVKVNGYTLVWDKISAPNGKSVYYSLEKYNDHSGVWESYRDSASSTDIYYNEETNQYYVKLYFYNPGSVTCYRLRAYVINVLDSGRSQMVYSDYSNTVAAKSLDIPKVTGIDISYGNDNNCILSWNSYDDVRNMLYKVYTYDKETEEYVAVCEPIRSSSYAVEMPEYGEVIPYRVSMYYYLNGEYFEGELSDCVYAGAIPETGICIYQDGVMLNDGESVEVDNKHRDMTFTAEVLSVSASNKYYTVTVSDNTIASVKDGVVTVCPSMATCDTQVIITAVSSSGEYTATYTVNVKADLPKDIYVFKIDNMYVANISAGVMFNTNVAATLYDGKVLVPVRTVSAAVGVNDFIYDAATDEITFTGFSGYKIKMIINSTDCEITDSDGARFHMTVSAPIVHNGTTMLSLRDMAMLTGGTVKYDSSGYVIASEGMIDNGKISSYIAEYENYLN